LNEEAGFYKTELLTQLDLREKELGELYQLKKDYENLQKRYYAISNSTLGRITFFYWRLRRKLSKKRGRM
jgi:hypothetical protein